MAKIITDRLWKNSSNEKVFNESKGDYGNTLKQSGYTNKILKYQQLITSNSKQNRRRNIIWFNPPFSRNVSTNVAKKFLQLLGKHFHLFNSFQKIFNCNTIKVSCCCTKSLGNIIKSDNKKLISSYDQIILSCNCRRKEECPLERR